MGELVAKDLQSVDALKAKLAPIVARGIDKSKKQDMEYLEKVKAHLEAGKQVRCGQWTNKEIDFINTLHLLTAKPAVFLVNVSEKDWLRQKNKHLVKIKQWIDEQTGEPMIPFSAEFEAGLLHMEPDALKAHLEENKTRSQISKIITTGFNAINLIYFFTAGPDEVRCWTIQKHWLAPQAAGRIHTDMEKGFICAEIIHWADFECLGSEVKCREEGKLHQQGRTYEMMDGDICFFKFNPQGRQEVDDVVTQCLVCSCV